MAGRRGMNNQERLAVDLAAVSATATIVSAPCFVYSITVSLLNTNATGIASIADVSASADTTNETGKFEVTLGAGGASAQGGVFTKDFNPPIYISRTLGGSVTGTKISVSYLAKS